jgi:hypothetical protein
MLEMDKAVLVAHSEVAHYLSICLAVLLNVMKCLIEDSLCLFIIDQLPKKLWVIKGVFRRVCKTVKNNY